MGLFENRFSSIRGKVPNMTGVFTKAWRTLKMVDSTIDYTRNDYDLYKSVYYVSSFNNKGRDMLLGAAFARPIVDVAAGFSIGRGYTVELDERIANKDVIEKELNKWCNANQSQILETYKHDLRDGDAYIYIDEFGNIEELDPGTVDVMLDPTTGLVIGYDVTENTVERNADNMESKFTIIKQYRTDSVKYTKYPQNQVKEGKGQVIYYRVFTLDGAVEPTSEREILADEIVERPLPIIHFANDKEARAVYGNSELLNCLLLFRHYHAVIENATKGVINSSNPIPYIIGVKDSSNLAKQSNKGETDPENDKINWTPDKVLLSSNENAKFGYVQANSFMADTGKLLEYYFYLIVQASKTPEFVFGTAVQSSKASVSEQMPILVQKIDSKRGQVTKPLQDLVRAYIDRQIRLSNPVYLPLRNQEYDINISFPDIVDEDKQLTLDSVKFLVEEGILSEKTALEVLMPNKVKDAEQEIADARADGETRATNIGATPTEPTRIQDELNGLTDDEV